VTSCMGARAVIGCPDTIVSGNALFKSVCMLFAEKDAKSLSDQASSSYPGVRVCLCCTETRRIG